MGWEEKLSYLFRIVMAAIPLNLWAKKINIALEINIDSYSLADRGKAPTTSRLPEL